MLIGRIVPDIMAIDLDYPRGLRSADYALGKHGAHHIGEEGHNVKLHRPRRTYRVSAKPRYRDLRLSP